MGQLLAHILKDKKTGRLSYRRAYPPELIPFLDVPAGRRHVNGGAKVGHAAA